jgi:dienelactone hydrolase
MGVGFTTRQVSFSSGGSRIAAELYLPAGPGPYPAVVFAHGFSGTMDWILPDFASVFAAGGLAVLLFDYRHFGSSEGQPRQLVDTGRQLEDIRAALAYARAHEAIDARRIGLWGTSLGGSHVINVASADPRIAAVVATVPALDMYVGLRGRHRPATFRPGPARTVIATLRLVGAAALDAIRGRCGLRPYYLPVYGPLGHAVFSDPALAERFRHVESNSPTWRNEVTPRFLFHAPRCRDGTVERIRCPVLVTLARDDAEVSSPYVRRKLGHAADVEIMEYPVAHFDVYHGPVRDEIARDQRDFLVRHLLRGPNRATNSSGCGR